LKDGWGLEHSDNIKIFINPTLNHLDINVDARSICFRLVRMLFKLNEEEAKYVKKNHKIQRILC